MTINIAHLVHPDGKGCYRFLWKANGQAVAMLRYDKDGTYTGATRGAVALCQAAWARKIEQGWKRSLLSFTEKMLTPDDRAFSDNLY